jgi:hypothetical protein
VKAHTSKVAGLQSHPKHDETERQNLARNVPWNAERPDAHLSIARVAWQAKLQAELAYCRRPGGAAVSRHGRTLRSSLAGHIVRGTSHYHFEFRNPARGWECGSLDRGDLTARKIRIFWVCVRQKVHDLVHEKTLCKVTSAWYADNPTRRLRWVELVLEMISPRRCALIRTRFST